MTCSIKSLLNTHFFTGCHNRAFLEHKLQYLQNNSDKNEPITSWYHHAYLYLLQWMWSCNSHTRFIQFFAGLRIIDAELFYNISFLYLKYPWQVKSFVDIFLNSFYSAIYVAVACFFIWKYQIWCLTKLIMKFKMLYEAMYNCSTI